MGDSTAAQWALQMAACSAVAMAAQMECKSAANWAKQRVDQMASLLAEKSGCNWAANWEGSSAEHLELRKAARTADCSAGSTVAQWVC